MKGANPSINTDWLIAGFARYKPAGYVRRWPSMASASADTHPALRRLSIADRPSAFPSADILQLPFALLNDGQLTLAQALKLPTFEYAGTRLIKRLTIIATNGLIRKVFYPVFPPSDNAREVIAWLTAHQV